MKILFIQHIKTVTTILIMSIIIGILFENYSDDFLVQEREKITASLSVDPSLYSYLRNLELYENEMDAYINYFILDLSEKLKISQVAQINEGGKVIDDKSLLNAIQDFNTDSNFKVVFPEYIADNKILFSITL